MRLSTLALLAIAIAAVVANRATAQSLPIPVQPRCATGQCFPIVVHTTIPQAMQAPSDYPAGAFRTVVTTVPAERIPVSEPDAARRVKVALALAADGQCGKCRTDLVQSRADALATGKPLVIFVGRGCDGLAHDVAGAVAVKVASYDRDGKPPTESRVVVVSTKGGEPVIEGTLPASASPVEVRAAVVRATKMVDWFADK